MLDSSQKLFLFKSYVIWRCSLGILFINVGMNVYIIIFILIVWRPTIRIRLLNYSPCSPLSPCNGDRTLATRSNSNICRPIMMQRPKKPYNLSRRRFEESVCWVPPSNNKKAIIYNNSDVRAFCSFFTVSICRFAFALGDNQYSEFLNRRYMSMRLDHEWKWAVQFVKFFLIFEYK